jgi:hypothetical protein
MYVHVAYLYILFLNNPYCHTVYINIYNIMPHTCTCSTCRSTHILVCVIFFYLKAHVHM